MSAILLGIGIKSKSRSWAVPQSEFKERQNIWYRRSTVCHSQLLPLNKITPLARISLSTLQKKQRWLEMVSLGDHSLAFRLVV